MPLAQRMYNTEQEMHSLCTEPQILKGTLRIGIVESLVFSGFLQLVAKYQERFPNVLLDFYTASSVEICELLSKNKLELACYLSEADTPSNYLQLLRKTVPMVFVANPKHPLLGAGSVPLEQIAEEKLVLTEQVSIYHQTLCKLFFRHGLPVKESVRIKSTRGIIEILKYNGGISFLPEYAVRQEVEQGGLSVIRGPILETEITVVAAAHKNRWISPQMQGMIDLFQQEKWL